MRSLLIVEDDPDIGSVLAMALEPAWRVTVCPDGRSALAALKKERPAAILLDLMLPDLDGAAFAREVAARGLSDLPILVVSAAHDIATRADQLGAQAWLRKPFDIEALEHKLAELGCSR